MYLSVCLKKEEKQINAETTVSNNVVVIDVPFYENVD